MLRDIARRTFMQIWIQWITEGHTERDSDGALNDKSEYWDGVMSSFQTSSGSACSILRVVYVFGSSEEIARRLLVFVIDIGPLHLV